MLRRTNPPLDVRAWIVVPFGNAMKAPDLEWLRDASVNLLSLDLGRWTDIHVVPDKRVGDLLRERVPAPTGAALTLSDGLSIARRAGAGRLVMGDFFKAGKGARFVANVFDVATGAKLRSAVQQTAEQDSLLTSFTPLALRVLAVPPPPDAAMGELGTSRLDAYQEYLIGVRLMNADVMLEARQHLERAIALDSTFALAHFQLSYVLGWGDPLGPRTDALQHALAAARLGTRLPRRERVLIDAGLASASREYGKACNIIAPLVARDSSDVQALTTLGECAFHDGEVLVSATDTTVATFRNSWNVSLHAFQRVLELDPSAYVAFEHIFEMLQVNFRRGCLGTTNLVECAKWRAVVLRGGDSLETVPVLYLGTEWNAQTKRAVMEHTSVVNLAASKTLAARWLLADTTSERAHSALAQTLLALGEVEGAHREFAHTPMRATPDNLTNLRQRLEVASKLGLGSEARTLADSAAKVSPDSPNNQYQAAAIDLSFGHFARWDAVVAGRAVTAGPASLAYFRQMGRALMGIPVPDLDRLAWAYHATIRDSICDRTCRLLTIFASHAYVIGLANPTWHSPFAPPFADTRSPLVYAVANGDSAAIRSATVAAAKAARDLVYSGQSEGGRALMTANAYLALHDSAAALVETRFFVDTAMGFLSLNRALFCLGQNMCMLPAVVFPRMMLLHADLEVAKGRPEAAKIWYDKLLDLWSTADPEFQPVVERVRKARAALGK